MSTNTALELPRTQAMVTGKDDVIPGSPTEPYEVFFQTLSEEVKKTSILFSSMTPLPNTAALSDVITAINTIINGMKA
ncbi:MAG: hypothetical protein KGL35_32195 [Bradyrhizobium sp.]|nr:hypothetical protein [Bradyrhizobium sp.]